MMTPIVFNFLDKTIIYPLMMLFIFRRDEIEGTEECGNWLQRALGHVFQSSLDGWGSYERMSEGRDEHWVTILGVLILASKDVAIFLPSMHDFIDEQDRGILVYLTLVGGSLSLVVAAFQLGIVMWVIFRGEGLRNRHRFHLRSFEDYVAAEGNAKFNTPN